jgi:hypothetical protein
MSTASRIGAAFGAGLLGFMLLSSPAMAGPEGKENSKPEKVETSSEGAGNGETDAHPGRNERQLEKGGSGTQGKSQSNPDGGGVDKPYPADGQPAGSQQGDYGPDEVNADDFDGNNGCGNDTDFSDDNNGNCGGLKKGHDDEVVDDEVDEDDVVVDDDKAVVDDTQDTGAVLSANETATESAQVMGIQIERAPETLAATAPAAQVLGMQIERSAPASLAATGLPLGLAAVAGFGLIGGGLAARRAARR